MPRAATQSQALALRERSSQPERTQASVRTQANVNSRTFVTNNNDRRSFQRDNRQNPTIAFGGSVRSNDRRFDNQDDRRRFEGTTETRSRTEFRHSRPPEEVFRNWDHRRIHTWNNNRYRWYGNDWIIVTGSYDPYYYDGSSSTFYDSTPAPLEFATTGNLGVEVQRELARRGYDPGSIDGVIGPQTRNAIAAFQNDRGMAVTGRIDRSLLNALDL